MAPFDWAEINSGAAPAPQAEGTMSEAEYKVQKEKFDSDWADNAGAAPAETARPVSLEEVELLLAEDVKYCRKHNKGDGYLVMTALKRVDGYARAFAKQCVEQAERLLTISAEALALEIPKVTELQAKVADLERELAAGQGPRYCKKCGGNQAYHRKDGCISHGTTGVDDNGKPTCKCTIKDFEPGELVSPRQPNHLTAAVNQRIADLEWERDNEIAIRNDWRRMAEENQELAIKTLDRATAADSETREMREALELAQKWLANCLPVGNIPGPKPLPVIARVLARKAGS